MNGTLHPPLETLGLSPVVFGMAKVWGRPRLVNPKLPLSHKRKVCNRLLVVRFERVNIKCLSVTLDTSCPHTSAMTERWYDYLLSRGEVVKERPLFFGDI